MNIVFMGGGKFAGLLRALFAEQITIVGYFDDVAEDGYLRQRYGVAFFGHSDGAGVFAAQCPNAFIGIGSEGDVSLRARYYKKLQSFGFKFPTLVHPSAQVGPNTELGSGTVVQQNAIVHPHVRIGNNCVISSGAIIGHDTTIDDNTYVAPGVIVNGSVSIGRNCFLGSGAVVIQNRTIGSDSLIGALACVVSDIPDGSRVKGVPGRTSGEI